MRTILFICAAFAVCFGDVPKPTHPNEEYPKSDTGLLPGNGRIVGGSNAADGANPWQASLRIHGSHTCGASIIGRKWLLCAAHCTQSSASDYTVYIGSIYRTSGGQSRNVVRIINHPNYGNGNGAYPNDISLIEVDKDMDSDLRISLGSGDREDFSNCRITGWGRTCGSCLLPETLQTASTTILSNSQCQTYWGNNINSGHVCIRKTNIGSCNGDSGGPLVCESGNNAVLVGATSWGASGCSTYYPSVYSFVSYFSGWINSNANLE